MKEIVARIRSFEEQTLASFSKQQYQERAIYAEFDAVRFPLFGIVGLRGVGKTTYLLSRRQNKENAVYISCDWTFLDTIDMVSLILYYVQNFAITTFYLDEIHFLSHRDQILKNVYDLGGITIIFSGSSKINMEKMGHDLSRRVFLKTLHVFSYGEYIAMTQKQNIAFDFKTLINDYVSLSLQYEKRYRKDVDKDEYMQYGEFGYFYQGFASEFNFLLGNSIKKSIYEDISQIVHIDTANLHKMKQLLFYIANMGASEISIYALSKKVGLTHRITQLYLEYLEQLGWIIILEKHGKLGDSIKKEKKIYLASVNLMHYFSLKKDDNFVGKLRETFFLQNMMRVLKEHDWIKFQSRTDFIVYIDGKEYPFEIGGKSKSRKSGFVVKDDISIASQNEIPLWLFGFME